VRPDLVSRVNGWMVVLRFVGPGMLAILLWWVGDLRAETKQMRHDLNNHLRTDVADINEMLGRIDERMKGIERRFNIQETP